jgi:membrane protein DedA with SNARE-associated domain
MEHLAGLLDWVGAHAAWAGPVVFLVALTESLALVGLLMPGALLMFGFGALIGSNHLAYWPIVLWAIAGAIIGDGLSYLLGRWFGPGIWAWPLFQRHSHLLQRSVDFFQRHGGKSIVFGRFVGPLRPVVPMVAGMMGMPAPRFLLINCLSGIIWAPAYLLPGQVLAASVSLAAAVASRLSLLILIALALLWLAAVVVRRTLRAMGRYGRGKRGIFGALISAALFCALVFAGMQWWPAPTSVRALSWRSWHDHPWEQLPLHRQGVLNSRQTFSFQLAAQPVEIARALVHDGWQLPERFNGHGALLWLSPEVDLIRTPPLPKRHAGRAPAMVFVRYYEGDRLVFRAWRSNVLLSAGNRPVWLVTVERVELTPGWPWLRQRELPVPEQALAQLREALERQLPPGSLCRAQGPVMDIHQECFG